MFLIYVSVMVSPAAAVGSRARWRRMARWRWQQICPIGNALLMGQEAIDAAVLSIASLLMGRMVLLIQRITAGRAGICR